MLEEPGPGLVRFVFNALLTPCAGFPVQYRIILLDFRDVSSADRVWHQDVTWGFFVCFFLVVDIAFVSGEWKPTRAFFPTLWLGEYLHVAVARTDRESL